MATRPWRFIYSNTYAGHEVKECLIRRKHDEDVDCRLHCGSQCRRGCGAVNIQLRVGVGVGFTCEDENTVRDACHWRSWGLELYEFVALQPVRRLTKDPMASHSPPLSTPLDAFEVRDA